MFPRETSPQTQNVHATADVHSLSRHCADILADIVEDFFNLPPEKDRHAAAQIKRRQLDCLMEDVVLELIAEPNQSDEDVAAKLGCTTRTVKKWRPMAGITTARVSTGDGVNSARIAVRVRLKKQPEIGSDADVAA